MHLGRFHAVVDHLERHFSEEDLINKLNAAAALDQYNQNRSESHIAEFKNNLSAFFTSSENVAEELLQPYAHQVIDELGLTTLFPPTPRQEINKIVSANSFDSAALAEALRKQAKKYQTKIEYLIQLDKSLRGLSAEYTVVEDNKAEVGLLLPREIVGETLPELTKEFDKISFLARAINELTGEQSYDPRVATISSSWWQIFLEVPIDQVALWAVAIERIVLLFKSNLEIKSLQRQLSEKSMPENILKLISEEVEKKVSSELRQIATDITGQFSKIEDQGRKNEVETQLRQGLHFLAKRLNQGAQVEINVGVPDEPKDPEVKEGEQPDQGVIEANAAARVRISELRKIREIGLKASESSLQVGSNAPLLLEDSSNTPPDSA
ncbi:hypothetical protein Dtpsy_3332 [[Acidovorax] ebreus TPSY]|uniref:Uncharacterized protein n=2 Tax=Diaphorobacter TaxID=238749 RepID=A0A9J9QF18_ACIET|nr:hypothetical protein Dtpsy_3332 [[Acidovorax] ebreus TPSY]